MRGLGTALFALVLAGHAFSLFISAMTVGTYTILRTQAEVSTTIFITVVAGLIQIAAFYLTGDQSTHRWRWAVAITMMVLLTIGMAFEVITYSSVKVYYTTGATVVIALIMSMITCGTLIWLRRSRRKI